MRRPMRAAGKFAFTAAREGGFTLVELLVSLAILGVLISSVFSVYQMQSRVTHIEADVVDVQQNMRMAIEGMTKDMRMAGFALPVGAGNPLGAVEDNTGLGGSDAVLINTASASGVAARIDADLSASVAAGSPITFTVPAGFAEMFSSGDTVRIINPGDRSQPAETVFTVSAVDASVPSITLVPQATTGMADFKRGYLIARTGSASPDTFPNNIRYCLGPAPACAPDVVCPAANCLMRIVNGAADESSIIASNISQMQLSYVLDDGQVSSAPADLSQVRDVSFTFTGQTVATANVSGAPKTRELAASARLRNR